MCNPVRAVRAFVGVRLGRGGGRQRGQGGGGGGAGAGGGGGRGGGRGLRRAGAEADRAGQARGTQRLAAVLRMLGRSRPRRVAVRERRWGAWAAPEWALERL